MRSAPPARRSSTVDDAGDLVAGLAHRLDGLQGRAAGGDDVLDDQAAVVGLEERALDAALQAVLLGLLADEEGLDVGAAGQRGAAPGRRRPWSGRRRRSPPTRSRARRPARPGRRSRRAAGSRAWRRRSTARPAPLVRTTSPRTRAWLRNSSISRSRACMRRVPYRACWRASCGRSRSSRARSCCSASPCSRSTRRATRPRQTTAAIAGPRGHADVGPVGRRGARARARALARAGGHRRRRRRARRAVRRTRRTARTAPGSGAASRPSSPSSLYGFGLSFLARFARGRA